MFTLSLSLYKYQFPVVLLCGAYSVVDILFGKSD